MAGEEALVRNVSHEHKHVSEKAYIGKCIIIDLSLAEG
jgi:hypothetical protein